MEQETIEGFSLSPQQSQVWSLLEGGRDGAYRTMCVIRMEGNLDAARLERAVRSVAARHEILRTTFRRLVGMEAPLQVIGDLASALRWVDLRTCSPQEKACWLENVHPSDFDLSSFPFDLEHGPLFQASFLSLDAEWRVLRLDLPALCADAVALGNLAREVGRCYEALGKGETLVEEPVQYADISGWLNELLASQEALARKYWQERNVFAALGVRLPFERESSESSRAFLPRSCRVPLPAFLRDRVEALASRPEISAESLLLSAWRVLLFRLTGAPDTVVASCQDGRRFEELRGALGLFARYLPVRTELRGEMSFEQVVLQTREAVAELSQWQESFTWQVFAGEEKGRYFPYCFEWHEPPRGEVYGGVSFSIDRFYTCIDRFRLKLSCLQRGRDLGLELHFDPQAFRSEEVERLAGWYVSLLDRMLANPQASVGALELLSEGELQYLLSEINEASVGQESSCTLVTLFERQVERGPHQVAVCFQDMTWTYGELAGRVRRLAQYLRSLGVGPEVRVALCVERSLEMVVGILGILEAGGAYVPLDPSYPQERLAFMLSDSQAPVLVTQGHLGDGLGEAGYHVVCLDRDAGEIAAQSGELLDDRAGPDGLAYVIYTSGSTGRPKGVMISHRAIVNRLVWMQEEFPLDPGDAVLQKTPFSFDASIWEIFLPLMTGARLVVAEPGGHQDVGYLRDVIREQAVTVLQLVPSMLSVFLEQEGLRDNCRSLRRVFCGGEAFPRELAQRFWKRLPGVGLCNLYGPTETAIDASFQVCGPEPAGTSMPIGRPLRNVQIHLMDREGHLVAPGLAGELCIGGVGLGRGYLEQPEKTAERFVPHAWSQAPGARLYRTGDLGRYRPDGTLEFLGRIDGQVKVRGFRIELGEIEAALRQHPAVREAVVVARDDEPGDRRLVGYVALESQSIETVLVGELRELLSARLPDFMVPEAIVALPQLPRLPNGKLDRSSLPAPGRGEDAGPETAFVAPRTPAEELLAGIWAHVLGLERVGVQESFFQLGGHSLAATRVVSRIREAFEVELRVRTLFEAPTVAGLAAEIEAARRSGAGLLAPPLVAASRGARLPLSFAQQRLWFLQQLEPESPAYNLTGALRLSGKLEIAVLESSISEVVRRHESLRTTFAAVDGEPVQVVHPAGPCRLSLVDLSDLPAERSESAARWLVTVEARKPFDLAVGPLLRVWLLHLGAQEHVLFLSMHHVISDGWSTGVLVRELTTLYGAFSQDRPSPLPDLPLQYADFAMWQRHWLQGDVLDAQLAYWKRQLQGAPQVLQIFLDRPRPLLQSYRGATLGKLLPRRLSEGLRQLGRSSSVTLFMAMLAAFDALLHRYGAGDDIVVGTNIAGRERLELEGLIGFFVNALVLRTSLSNDLPFRSLLERTREIMLGAFSHQDLPFERLVEELQPQRNLGVTPLFQIGFDFNRAEEMGRIDLPHLGVQPFPFASATSKLDLNLAVADFGEDLSVALEYSTDVLSAPTVQRLLEHLEVLLGGIVENPDRRVGDLPLLGEAEAFQLLTELQGEERLYPVDRTIDRLFAEQVLRSPERIAAVHGSERLTYAELEHRSAALARRLRHLGVGPGCFVGILDERGIGFLTAMLAVFRAGGAYVPFEPSYPEDRLRYMITNSGIGVLVARTDLIAGRQGLLGDCPELRGVVCLGASGEEAEPGSEAVVPWPPGDPRDPAYMLYTSGSTGLPKGAVIRHDGAVNHIWAQVEALELGPELCFLQSAPSSSDISVWQFLAPLVLGGRTVIVDLETVSDPRQLLRVLWEERVTIVELVPAVLRDLLDHAAGLMPEEQSLPDLRWMMATGEAVPVDLVNDWLTLYPEIRAINAYGPTEASDDVTQAIFDRPLPRDIHSLPIGRPLANFSCHVVGRGLQLVPLEVPGELCIGGIGVGSGYWRNPEKTGASFVPDPFARLPGAVLYRTGDLVRWRAGGWLEYLGRIDHQIKIRGFRIELGEIEAALRESPGVRDAVVVVRGEGAARSLVAYVAGEEEALATGRLRDGLQARLPGHMVPAEYVLLASLPRTPNGKIDRRALPAPDRSARASRPLDPPRTPVERKLAEIWAHVFQIEAVGRDTDFFEIGGHSLLAVRVLSRAQAAFEVDIPLRQIFEHSTIAGFARVVEESRRRSAALPLPGIKPVARQAQRLPSPASRQAGTRARK